MNLVFTLGGFILLPPGPLDSGVQGPSCSAFPYNPPAHVQFWKPAVFLPWTEGALSPSRACGQHSIVPLDVLEFKYAGAKQERGAGSEL